MISQAKLSRLLQVPNRYSLGDGLLLLVRAPGKASYSMRVTVKGARKEIGLGAHPAVTQAMARESMLANKRALAEGKDPTLVRESVTKTFDEVVAAYLADHGAALGTKAIQAWRATLGTYASPVIGPLDVGTITVDHVLDVLRPIWTTKSPTATKLQRRMSKVFAYARARGWTTGDNPARWIDQLQMVLPKPGAIHREQHQAAVPFEKLPAVMKKLAADEGTASLAVRFAALTAQRATAVSHASWSEFDTTTATWTIPLERSKGHDALRIPLSKQALEVLKLAAERRTTSDFVFPGQRNGKPLSLTALVKALRRAGGGDGTTHGLRSGFKSFTVERGLSRELAELQLGHLIGTDVERAYRNTDALEPRRKLVQAYGDFLTR